MPPFGVLDEPGARAGRAGERALARGRRARSRAATRSAPRNSARRTARAARGLPAWMARAASSLPVPVSPVMSTVPGAAAARRIRSLTFAIASARRRRARRATGRAGIWRCSRSTCRASCRRSAADAHAHQQLVAEERLLHEVDGAELHRLDRGVDGAEAGHHDEGRVDAHVAQLAGGRRCPRGPASACPTG